MDNNNITNSNFEEDIDLTKIDWRNLSVENFHKLEKKLQENNKILKEQRKKDKIRLSGTTMVKIRGNTYEIKTVLFNRLKTLKSEKSREKLINEIISTHNAVESI